MGFEGFPTFWRKVLQKCRKSSCGRWARPKKRRSSPSGGGKVVSGAVFLPADIFRARIDIYFSWAGPRIGPGKAQKSETPKPPPTYYLVGGGSQYFGLYRGLSGVPPRKNICLLGLGICLRTKIRPQRQLFRHQMGLNGAFLVSPTCRNYFSGTFEVMLAKL